MKRRIAILGSTGSIGRQTLDVVRQHPDLFQIELLTANNSTELLIAQAREFDANSVVICNESHYHEVADALQPDGIKVFAGIQSACDLVAGDNIDIVVASMVGFSGLAPTVAAVKAGKVIALANKETLVAAGSVVMGLAEKHHAPILPVDSEHSAIFQCLLAAQGNALSRIHLTASGGPFRTWDKTRIAKATKDMALRHPNWNMGAKITIDSATMMNKGFEVIVPERLPLNNRKLDFAELGTISFAEPDMDRFPALALAFGAIRRGGNIPCVLNAANEAAVAAYLKDRIGFYDIARIAEECMAGADFVANPSLDDIFASNDWAFRRANELIDKWLY